MRVRLQPSGSRTTNRRVAWAVAGIVVIGVAIGAVAGFRMLRVAADLRHARTLTTSAGNKIESGELASARADLRQAEQLLIRSNSDLYNRPELDAVGWVPGIRENLDSLRYTVGLALQMVSGGDRILTLSKPLENAQGKLDVPLRAGAIPLATVTGLQREVTALAQALPGQSERPTSRRLIGEIGDAQQKVFAEAVRRRAQLAAVSRGLTLLNEMAGGNGPRRYLIAVANTAEMRGSGGMILSYGVLEGSNGTFTLPSFGNIDELFIDPGIDVSGVPVSADEAQRWTGLEPNRLWRNANLVPDINVVGPRLLKMYSIATRQQADGVIQIDANGLAAILRGIGPVAVDGLGEVNADNVVDLTLNRAYTLFPNRDQRQEVLGDVAKVVFQRLVQGNYSSLRPLGEALLRSASERHVILWSSHSDAESPAAFFHADGALPPPDEQDSFMLTVQNFAHNKLDYYLDTSVTVTGAREPGVPGSEQVKVTLTNTAPAGTVNPIYVFGDGQTGVPPGTYGGIGSLYVPNGTKLASSSAADATLLAEDKRTVIGWQVQLAPGESLTYSFELTLPPRRAGGWSVALAPVPRVRPTLWSLDVSSGPGQRARFDGRLLTPVTIKSSATQG